MKESGWLLALVAIIYVMVGIGYLREDRIGMFIAWTAYSVANVGFILDAMGI